MSGWDEATLREFRARLDDPAVSRREIDGRWFCATRDGVVFSRPKAPNLAQYEGSFYLRPTDRARRGEQDCHLPREERISDPVCGPGFALAECERLFPGAVVSLSIGGGRCRASISTPDGATREADARTPQAALAMAITDLLILSLAPTADPAAPGPR